MDNHRYCKKRIRLEKRFEVVNRQFSLDENRNSLKQFNDILENSWKLTINKYKEIKTINHSLNLKFSDCNYKDNSSCDDSYVIDKLDTGCYWNLSVEPRFPMVDLSKY